MNTEALTALAAQARAELALLSWPDRDWVVPRSTQDGQPVHAVAIVGGGQSGLAIAHALHREGVRDVLVLDRRPAGSVGVWDDFARMDELRTPKALCGIECGQPSLSVQRWYATAYGQSAWDRLERLPRRDWIAYLTWFREAAGIAITSDCEVTAIAPHADAIALTTSRLGTVLARHVVVATGHDSAGAWTLPEVITRALPRERYDHSNGPIDFARLRGKRVGVLGHGASAFDAAVAALRAGAARVDLCFRRAVLPTANPHRYVETPGFMAHYPALPDAARWQVARHFRVHDQPPAEGSFRAALAAPGFHMHPACPWTDLALDGEAIRVETPRLRLHLDHVIGATGLHPGLHLRPELAQLAPRALLWGECFQPAQPDAVDRLLALYPYLGPQYEFLPRDPADAWVQRVRAFSAASVVSHGPHSTSISGHRHGVPRVVHGLTRALFLEQTEALLDGLQRYDAADLVLPHDAAA